MVETCICLALDNVKHCIMSDSGRIKGFVRQRDMISIFYKEIFVRHYILGSGCLSDSENVAFHDIFYSERTRLIRYNEMKLVGNL